MPTADSRLKAELERINSQLVDSKLLKAGLKGPYLGADSEVGRRVYGLVAEGRGSYLWGEPGTGKTWSAACAVRLSVEAEGFERLFPNARLVTAKRLLDEVREGFDGGDRSALERAERVGLLALDDLGAERPTEWAIETLTRLLDTRFAAGLPTVVTSNYRIGQLRDLWGGMAGKRVASRLAGSCEPIEVAGPDRRLA